MRVVFLGSGEFALPTLRFLQSNHDIRCVITQPDRQSGRGRRLTPTPVKAEAEALGLEVIATPNVNDASLIERVRGMDATVGVVVAFGQKIGAEFRATMPGECINLHASLLPKYRGAAPFQWAIIRGERVTGVTVFKLVDRMDAGAILSRRETTIGATETASELHDRLAAEQGPEAVADALGQFERGSIPAGEEQDDTLASKAPKLSKQDGYIGFAQPATTITALVNGLWSWPGAACMFESADGGREEIVMLARARAVDQSTGGEPGVLDERLCASAAAGSVEVLEIKPRSGALMSWRDYCNGRHVAPGDRFVSLKQ